jgi:tRNA nucleotidyltransferase (CCA-adding enzyme)
MMKTYLVGGAVRDKLLGHPFHERDWVVVGSSAQELLDLGYQPVGKDFPVFLHPKSKEEYALARTERKSGPGYTGFDCFASPNVTLEEDLQRRDLTINAIAEDGNGNLIDPYGGQQDITDKIFRHVSPAFVEDPLRLLRIARFSARYAHLGFLLADETTALLQKISAGNELLALPAERVWKELQRSLVETSPQQFFYTLQKTDALKKLLPELSSLTKKNFSVLQLAIKEKNPAIGFALLFIDLELTGAEQLCQRLKAPKEYRELALLINRHGGKCQQPFTHAEQLLDLLEQLDPFRRSDRFYHFLRCTELLFNNQVTTQQMEKAFKTCTSINAAKLAEEGLKGKAIANALRNRRLTTITQLIGKDHD